MVGHQQYAANTTAPFGYSDAQGAHGLGGGPG
jgi:hypothetical protein